LIEAFAAGRPVVATPVGGVTDVVKEGVTGLLVPPDDPTQLADALRKIEADGELRKRLGEAGRELVRSRFHKDIVIEKLSALYEKLADRRRVA
jgi:glycosyltransferase involved in cell wall biosynthesis